MRNYYTLGLLLTAQYSMSYIPRHYFHLHTLVSRLVHASLHIHLRLVMVPLVVLGPAFAHMHPTMIRLLWMLCLPLFPTMAYLSKYLGPSLSLVDNNGHRLFRPFSHRSGIRLL